MITPSVMTKINAIEKFGFATITGEPKEAYNEEIPKLSATPKMKLLYENILFVLENKRVYLDKDINLTKLSQMLFTNTTYLSKVVNKFFGCNLKTLLNSYRVEYAKQLLRNDSCSMNELAARCGFLSRSTFKPKVLLTSSLNYEKVDLLSRNRHAAWHGTGVYRVY